jgi:hypothetical protein
MSACIRYNEDYSEYEVVLPDGTALAKEAVPEEGVDEIAHPDDPNQRFLVVLMTYDEEDGFYEPNTIYRVTAEPTELEDGCDFDAEDAEDGEDPEEAEETPADGIV